MPRNRTEVALGLLVVEVWMVWCRRWGVCQVASRAQRNPEKIWRRIG